MTPPFGLREPCPDPLSDSLMDDDDTACPDLLDRWAAGEDRYAAWSAAGLLPCPEFSVEPAPPRLGGLDTAGRPPRRVNFASHDPLGLADHPRIRAAAVAAVEASGVHAAGPAAPAGLGDLEAEIARFTACRAAKVFPTGWGARYGLIRALVRPTDHVVIDALADAGLHDAAAAATPAVHRFAHLSTDAVARRLSRLRDVYPEAGILVVTESLFGLESDTPDIGALQTLCRRYRATLLLDVSHDLGAHGSTGRGALEVQGMLGAVDLVTGSFFGAFASNGGFVAADHPGLRPALRFGKGAQGLAGALSPVQAAVVREALQIVQEPEGASRRARLMANALALRAALQAEGLEIPGVPSAIVPVILGAEAPARRLTAALLAEGAILNLAEPPPGARLTCRWQLRVTADHSAQDIADFTRALRRARDRLAPPTGRTRPPSGSMPDRRTHQRGA